ncbi:MAG: PAS domain-containing protein [Paracoccaceae bacterium]
MPLRALEHSRSLFDTDALPDIVYLVDVEKQENVFVNKAVETVLLFSAEEIADLGSNLFPSIIHPDDLPSVGEHYAKLDGLGDGEARAIEYRVRRKDGVYLWFRSTDSIFERKADGSPKLLLGSANDISQMKQREETIQMLNSELSHRVQNIFATVQALISKGQRSSLPSDVVLNTLQRRLSIMARMHAQARNTRFMETTSLVELIRAFEQALPDTLNIGFDIAPIPILPNMITSLGIFLNEVFCLEFAHETYPEIPDELWLKAHRDGDDAMLTYSQANSPENAVDRFCAQNMRVLNMVADSLNGSMSYKQEGDVLMLTLTFPVEDLALSS